MFSCTSLYKNMALGQEGNFYQMIVNAKANAKAKPEYQ